MKNKTHRSKVKRVAVFFNNFRGANLSNFLKSKKYFIYNIVTKKFLNKKILKTIDTENNFRLIKNLKDQKLIKLLKKQKLDLIIAAGFPHIFQKKFFSLAKNGIINLHAGRLPKYRGGSPLNWQIINNEKKIGISVIKMDKKIDHGPIISKANFKNLKTDDIKNIHLKANKLFLKLTLKAIDFIDKKKFFKKQKKSNSYFRQRSDQDSKLNFNESADQVFNFIRALTHPYKGAFFLYKKKKVRILKCRINKYKIISNPGTIFKFKNKKNFLIKCKINNIEVIKSKPFLKEILNKKNYETF